jgi:hypothetical protein
VACGPAGFHLTLKNGTTHDIYDAHVEFDGFRSLGGVFGAGTAKTHVDLNRAIPSEATVVWRNPDEQSFSKRVVVPANLRSAEELVFTIHEDATVSVSDRRE